MASETPYYKIKSAVGGYRAYFHGKNGEIVWHTETYKKYETAEQAIAWNRAWAASAPLR